jgi:surfeit locus 1 family protein
MKLPRLPIVPTLIVLAAVATMIGLGIWQIRRASEKEELLAHYRAAAGQPPVAWPTTPGDHRDLLFRRATGFCTEVTEWGAIAGRNRAAQPGWSHIASCRTGGLEGPGMQVDMGWGRDHHPPQGWRGGAVTGIITSDRHHQIKLVSETAAPGLQPSAPPNLEDVPNNHMLYAWQWFFFAASALIIYIIALRGRQKVADAAPKA